jgi:8-oxo-dGTP pyrophosphatase MutT (NUDIX family)
MSVCSLPLRAQLQAHAQADPAQAALAAQFIDLLDDSADAFVRERLAGHFTGSAWLVSADGARALLMHHRKLQRWLQPGGHADGERDLAAVALKEAQEESGLGQLRLEDGQIFDLDKHWIPERADVPGHWHFDVRYVIRNTGSEAFVINPESLALAWRAIADIATDPASDASLARMARRWLGREASNE